MKKQNTNTKPTPIPLQREGRLGDFFRTAIVLLIPLLLGGVRGGCQNIAINTTGAVANASAILDVSATNLGLLIPRVALTNAASGDHSADPVVPNPNNRLFVFNTNATVAGGNGVGLYYYDSTNATTGKWVYVAAPSNGPGNNGDVLLSGGVNASPQWTNPSVLSGGGGCLPTQISNAYWGTGGAAYGGGNATVNWRTCITNCDAYAGTGAGDGGFTDWRMPTVEEYTYAYGAFAAPASGWLSQFFWSRFVFMAGLNGWMLLYESNGDWSTNAYTATYYCRCVR